MNIIKSVKCASISSLLLIFVSMTCFVPIVQATMISTGQMMNHNQAQQDRSHVTALLNRAELAGQLKNSGVDPVQLQARVDALTDEEVSLLANQLDLLPAGSGILGAAVFIFLVLLATDILGYTEIFPFVKNPVNLNQGK